jgi:hypothetical protein
LVVLRERESSVFRVVSTTSNIVHDLQVTRKAESGHSFFPVAKHRRHLGPRLGPVHLRRCSR